MNTSSACVRAGGNVSCYGVNNGLSKDMECVVLLFYQRIQGLEVNLIDRDHYDSSVQSRRSVLGVMKVKCVASMCAAIRMENWK